MQKIFQQDSRQARQSGSALVYSLVILFMLLTVALGVASVSVVERKNASSTGKSVQSFQVADSAIELVLKKASDQPLASLNDMAALFGSGTCAAGAIKGTILSNPVELIFSKDGTASNNCATTLAMVDEVKAVGQYSNTARAINAAVASGTTYTQLLSNESYSAKSYISMGKNQALIIFSGSVFRTTTANPGQVGIIIKVDGVEKGRATIYHRANENATAGTFRTVSGTAVLSNLVAGQNYNITIEAISGTTIGADSLFSLAIVE